MSGVPVPPIYLDWNAATPPEPEILEVVERARRELWANPSSPHAAGRRARAAVEEARESVAALLGVPPGSVTFVSSGTEALNLVATGLVARPGRPAGSRRHVVASAVEHKALLEPLVALERAGSVELELTPVDASGVVAPEELARRLRPGETAFAAVLAAQNETGVLQPLEELARVAAAAQVPLVVDAAQAIGRIARDWRAVGWDYLVLSAHKLRAPRGAAALVRRRERPAPEPLLRGGGQELGHRAGTEDVAAIVGLGAACARLLRRDLAALERALLARRERFEASLLRAIPGSRIAGSAAPRLPQTTSLLVPGGRSEDLLAALDLAGIQASAGSACSSGAVLPSHVLAAMGVADELARGAVRLSFGETTTDSELDEAAGVLERVCAALRSVDARAAVATPSARPHGPR